MISKKAKCPFCGEPEACMPNVLRVGADGITVRKAENVKRYFSCGCALMSSGAWDRGKNCKALSKVK